LWVNTIASALPRVKANLTNFVALRRAARRVFLLYYERQSPYIPVSVDTAVNWCPEKACNRSDSPSRAVVTDRSRAARSG